METLLEKLSYEIFEYLKDNKCYKSSFKIKKLSALIGRELLLVAFFFIVSWGILYAIVYTRICRHIDLEEIESLCLVAGTIWLILFFIRFILWAKQQKIQ